MISEIRQFFPALNRKIKNKRLIYFDNACSVLKPQPVIEAINYYNSNLGVCAGGRSNHLLSQETQELCDESRELVKKIINARFVDEIIWVKNSTEGINLVAKSFRFTSAKNEVLISNLEHHSNILPFYELEKKGIITLKIVDVIDRKGDLNLEKFKKSITNKTALISITHCSNITGQILAVEEICVAAHQKGVFVLVDDAQYIATHREDVQYLETDFLVFSSHKIGGPSGMGVLYVKKEAAKMLDAFCVGGGTVNKVDLDDNGKLQVNYLNSPQVWEAGIQNYSGIIGLGAAVKFINQIGYDEIAKHTNGLLKYLIENLKKIKQVVILGNGNREIGENSPLVSFVFNNNKSLIDFNMFLNDAIPEYSIAVRYGHHCAVPAHQTLGVQTSLRVSLFVYNMKEEIDIFLDCLNKFLNY